MDSRVPLPVQDILSKHISIFQERIPDNLEGLYLHGSIALNAYINGSSDIDFIAVLKRQLTDAEMGILSDIHQDLKGKYKIVMDGCYLLKGEIGKRQTETKKCLSVNLGKVAWESHVINPVLGGFWRTRESALWVLK